MTAAESLPWHADAWARLSERVRAETLPHALLLAGLPGLGKRRLATSLAVALLCERRTDSASACGECRSCRLVAQSAHPDFFMVEPEEERKQIRIDQMRALIERLSLRSQYGRYRIGLIAPADRMNTAAANALLKTLEEPPSGAVLLLTAARPARLPATVRSRCQQLALQPPSAPVAQEWLRAQGVSGAQEALGLALGAPLRAIELHQSGAVERWRKMLSTMEQLRAERIGVVAAAAEWRETGAEAIPMLLAICADLARLAAGGTVRYGDPGRLRPLVVGLDLLRLHDYVEQLLEQRRYLDHSLNEQLLLESVFAGWLAAAGKARPTGAQA